MAKPKRYQVFPKAMHDSVWSLEMARKWLSASLSSYPGHAEAPWQEPVIKMLGELSEIIIHAFKTAREVNMAAESQYVKNDSASN